MKTLNSGLQRPTVAFSLSNEFTNGTSRGVMRAWPLMVEAGRKFVASTLVYAMFLVSLPGVTQARTTSPTDSVSRLSGSTLSRSHGLPVSSRIVRTAKQESADNPERIQASQTLRPVGGTLPTHAIPLGNDIGGRVSARPVAMIMSGTTFPGTYSSISSNFNGTAISNGSYLWFSSVLKVSGVGSNPVRVFLRSGTVRFTANGVPYTLPVPDTTLTIVPTATTSTTTYDAVRNLWSTKVQKDLSGNTYLS